MNTNVIKLSSPEKHIALVSMEDREGKNTFTKNFTSDVYQVFSEIDKQDDLKVVVIHGYDNFFCCGGSKEELLTLTEGTKTFTDLGFYRLLLDCKIPVISAMQGHAIGGGLAFGCFADMLVMANEAFYTTNFMKYGFTPGFGSTYIIPKKFGESIAESMLFGAQNFQGNQLKQLGVSACFVKKLEVINTAMAMARKLAIMPRESLYLLKQQLTREDKDLLPKYIEQELAMHKITFTLPEVKVKINELFGR